MAWYIEKAGKIVCRCDYEPDDADLAKRDEIKIQSDTDYPLGSPVINGKINFPASKIVDPKLAAIKADSLKTAQLEAQTAICAGRERLMDRVMTSGRYQGLLIKSLLIALDPNSTDRPQILIDMLRWIDSTLEYFADRMAAVMAAENAGQVNAISWDWDQFLNTYPGYTLWNMTQQKIDCILPVIGIEPGNHLQ